MQTQHTSDDSIYITNERRWKRLSATPVILPGIVLSAYVASIILVSNLSGFFLISNGLAAVVGASALLQMIILRNDFVYLPGPVWILFLFLFVLTLGTLWAPDRDEALKRTISVAQLIVLSIAMLNILWRMKRLWPLLLGVLIGNTVAAITAIAESGLRLFEVQDVSQYGSFLVNANEYGISLIMGVFAAWYSLHKAQNRTMRVVMLILIVLFAYQIIFFSGSRKAILSLFALLPFYYAIRFLIQDKDRSQSLTRAILTLLIIMFAAIPLLEQTPFFDRFENLSQDLQEGNRGHYLQFGLERWRERPILGYGTNQFRVIYEDAGYRSSYSHNNLVELLTNNGLVGVLFYYGAFLYLALIYMRLLKDKLVDHTLLVTALVLLITILQWDLGTVSYYSRFTWLGLVILLALPSFYDPVWRRNFVAFGNQSSSEKH